MMMLIAIDICVNFRVARFKEGQLVTDGRQLALDYLKGYFLVDLLSGGVPGSPPHSGCRTDHGLPPAHSTCCSPLCCSGPTR